MTSGAKLIVLFPQPKNVEEFESFYREQHAFAGRKDRKQDITRRSEDRRRADGAYAALSHHRNSFSDAGSARSCLGSPAGQLAVLQAVRNSTGGAPVFLIAEEQTTRFGW